MLYPKDHLVCFFLSGTLYILQLLFSDSYQDCYQWWKYVFFKFHIPYIIKNCISNFCFLAMLPTAINLPESVTLLMNVGGMSNSTTLPRTVIALVLNHSITALKMPSTRTFVTEEKIISTTTTTLDVGTSPVIMVHIFILFV